MRADRFVLALYAGKSLANIIKTWPVCHVSDNSTLYLQILSKILAGEDIGYGESGYFLASPGSVAWDDLYSAIADSMLKRGLVNDNSITLADDSTLKAMGEAIDTPKELVVMQLGGL